MRIITKHFGIYQGRLETERERDAVICFIKEKREINYFAAELLHVTRKHDNSTGRTVVELAVTVALHSPQVTSLNPWNRVLLENLTGSQLVKKLSSPYGTRSFIAAFTNALNLSLS